LELILHIDGGARGNPGPAGAGVVLQTAEGERIHEGAYFLGTQTNNSAEYMALLRGLTRAMRIGKARVQIRSDSELLVKQLTGEYRVRHPGLQPLFEQAQLLLMKLDRWQIRHVRREQNRRADELANLAMDQKRDVLVFDVESGESGDPAATAPTVDTPEARMAPPAEATDASPAVSEAPAGRNDGDSGAVTLPRVQVTVSQRPVEGQCPAGCPFPGDSYVVAEKLPEGLCVHAAHALLPTVLAVVNTASHEVAAVPTMTVRCSRRECRATFLVSPAQKTNGRH
jgi:ribonuclease HI